MGGCLGKWAGLRAAAGNFVQTESKLQISSGRRCPPLFPYLRLNTFHSVVNRPVRGGKNCGGFGGQQQKQQQQWQRWEGKASCCCCWLWRKSLFPTAIRT